MKHTLTPDTVKLRKENTVLKQQVFKLRKDLERAKFRTRELQRELMRQTAEKDAITRQAKLK